MKYNNRIEANHNIMLGKPVIKGTRITVETILNKMSQGATFENILKMYPNLIKENINACIAYVHV
ncbi:MAG: DUF433 domain-containing protein [Bacteroidales bacterium]|nr:DUF433 domain-containing protein [Bacteroidales bacterium]